MALVQRCCGASDFLSASNLPQNQSILGLDRISDITAHPYPEPLASNLPWPWNMSCITLTRDHVIISIQEKSHGRGQPHGPMRGLVWQDAKNIWLNKWRCTSQTDSWLPCNSSISHHCIPDISHRSMLATNETKFGRDRTKTDWSVAWRRKPLLQESYSLPRVRHLRVEWEWEPAITCDIPEDNIRVTRAQKGPSTAGSSSRKEIWWWLICSRLPRKLVLLQVDKDIGRTYDCNDRKDLVLLLQLIPLSLSCLPPTVQGLAARSVSTASGSYLECPLGAAWAYRGRSWCASERQ